MVLIKIREKKLYKRGNLRLSLVINKNWEKISISKKSKKSSSKD